jgi:hypothetical protein
VLGGVIADVVEGVIGGVIGGVGTATIRSPYRHWRAKLMTANVVNER